MPDDDLTPREVQALLEHVTDDLPHGRVSSVVVRDALGAARVRHQRRLRAVMLAVAASAALVLGIIAAPLLSRDSTGVVVPTDPTPTSLAPDTTEPPVPTTVLPPPTVAEPPPPPTATATSRKPAPTAIQPSVVQPSIAPPPKPTSAVAPAPIPPPEPIPGSPTASAPFKGNGGMGEGYYFVSPSGNIGCALFNGGAGCQTRKPVTDLPACGSPDTNTTFAAIKSGPAYTGCTGPGTYAGKPGKVLPYGQSLTASGYTCTSATTGITCINQDSHGFTISSERVTTF